MDKQHTYLKHVIFKKDVFSHMNEHINEQYRQLKQKKCRFNEFYSWSLLATVLGIFTSRGDIGSTWMFLSCLQQNYLPKISIINNKDSIKICICINEKELNERKSKFQNTSK